MNVQLHCKYLKEIHILSISKVEELFIGKGGKDMEKLHFEELEIVEDLADASDYGAAFGIGFLVGIVIYVGLAT